MWDSSRIPAEGENQKLHREQRRGAGYRLVVGEHGKDQHPREGPTWWKKFWEPLRDLVELSTGSKGQERKDVTVSRIWDGNLGKALSSRRGGTWLWRGRMKQEVEIKDPIETKLSIKASFCYRIFLYEGSGTPLQYSCLENPMGRGAW